LSDAARLPFDWSRVDLAVFDVDGTLYDQRRLRLAMLGRLAAHAWRTRSLETLRLLRTFRRVREALADQPGADFMQLQYSETARRHGCPPEQVQALVAQWMETAPLPLLADCRYAGLPQLFAALRAAGKRIGVLSDYPATAKLAALGLECDLVVSACDDDIGCLKPDPRGLLALLRRAGVPPERAVMIGDRFERDAEVARRAGVPALIRSGASRPGVITFRRYDDPLFQPLLTPAAVPAAA